MQKLLLFENIDPQTDKGIYIHTINIQTKKAMKLLGGIQKTAKILNEAPGKVKEWYSGRKPISLIDANRLFQTLGGEGRTLIKEINSNSQTLGCRYSAVKMTFPKLISAELAYCVGLILGDGHLPKDSLNRKTAWQLGVCFDNKKHQKLYDLLVKDLLGILPAHYHEEPKCFESCINSKVAHWFFSKYFKIPAGKKCIIISLPENILSDEKLTLSAIRGLFDSDGCITMEGSVQFGSTSKRIVEQIRQELAKQGIAASTGVWIKDEKYLPLYSIRISRKSNNLFAEKIGFGHPLKKVLLEQFS